MNRLANEPDDDGLEPWDWLGRIELSRRFRNIPPVEMEDHLEEQEEADDE